MNGDDSLRAAWRALAEGARPTDLCPSAETVFDASTGALPPDQVAPVVDHVGRCAVCAEAWRLATAIAADEGASGAEIVPFPAPPPEPEPLPANDVSAWRRFWPALAVGLAAAVALVAVGQGGLFGDTIDPVYRDGAADTLTLDTPAPELRAPRADLVLTWSGAPDGSTYEIVVTDPSLAEIASAKGLSEPRFVLTADRFASVPSGATLLWRVEAFAPDGKRVASPTWRILVD